MVFWQRTCRNWRTEELAETCKTKETTMTEERLGFPAICTASALLATSCGASTCTAGELRHLQIYSIWTENVSVFSWIGRKPWCSAWFRKNYSRKEMARNYQAFVGVGSLSCLGRRGRKSFDRYLIFVPPSAKKFIIVDSLILNAFLPK